MVARRKHSLLNSRHHPIFAMLFGVSTTLLLLVVALHSVVMEEDAAASYAGAIEDAVDGILQSLSRKRSANDDPNQPRRKRQMKSYDRERAYQCVLHDYLGPYPIFNDRQFERIFRVSRSVTDYLLTRLPARNYFFQTSYDRAKRKSIYPEVKLLTALKIMGYGVAGIAFCDYFQMGESTALLCVMELATTIVTDEEIRSTYMRKMTPADARRVEALHRREHKVPGLIGYLDCMHISWKNCPMAHQGQYKGKEGHPTLVLEGMCDYNLWFWHVAFGYPGALNDINVWERSPLLESFIDGSFALNDFRFIIDGIVFTLLYVLGK